MGSSNFSAGYILEMLRNIIIRTFFVDHFMIYDFDTNFTFEKTFSRKIKKHGIFELYF